MVEFSRDLMLFLACAKASEVIHHRLLYRVMKSPMVRKQNKSETSFQALNASK